MPRLYPYSPLVPNVRLIPLPLPGLLDGVQVQAPEAVSPSEKEDLSRYDYLLHHSPFRALPHLTRPLHSHTPHNSVVAAHGEVSTLRWRMGGV